VEFNAEGKTVSRPHAPTREPKGQEANQNLSLDVAYVHEGEGDIEESAFSGCV
jgi:hypothetical protein